MCGLRRSRVSSESADTRAGSKLGYSQKAQVSQDDQVELVLFLDAASLDGRKGGGLDKDDDGICAPCKRESESKENAMGIDTTRIADWRTNGLGQLWTSVYFSAELLVTTD